MAHTRPMLGGDGMPRDDATEATNCEIPRLTEAKAAAAAVVSMKTMSSRCSKAAADQCVATTTAAASHG
eukprot:4120929-Amphidinium_carterae.1